MGLFNSVLNKLRGDSVSRVSEGGIASWVEKQKDNPVFKGLSADALTEMCSRMESVPVQVGTVLIKEGDQGDCFYILAKGTVQVTRDAAPGQPPVVLAELGEGAGFGEDALISNAARNATITVVKAGTVMRLSKPDFVQFLKEPRLDWMSPVEAYKAVQEGAQWLDVRTAAEFKKGGLPGAMSMPVLDLRGSLAQLDRERCYVCYCSTGRQSASAAYILAQHGIRVAVLRGGLRHLPNFAAASG